MSTLLLKYKEYIENHQFHRAIEIEKTILGIVEFWDFDSKDRIIEELTLSGI